MTQDHTKKMQEYAREHYNKKFPGMILKDISSELPPEIWDYIDTLIAHIITETEKREKERLSSLLPKDWVAMNQEERKSELIEEVEKRIHAREMDIRQIGEHLGCNEDELMNEMAQMLRWDYIALLTTTIARVREEERETERGRAIIVMSEFAAKKGEDYPLGQYLNMLCALDRIKSLSEWMAGDKEKLCSNCGVDTRKYPHKNCVISSCDCYINLEKGEHWPGCVHYKKE